MNRKPIEWEGISSYISDRGVLEFPLLRTNTMTTATLIKNNV